jgi:glycosyltransferase involved in cell wall biosynthesis
MLPRFSPWATLPGRELLPVARNAWVRSRLLDPDRARAKPVVLFVENGSGFGGAIVALQTLLQALPCDRFDYHVITNVAVGGFGTHPAVRSHRVIGDELIDFRPLAGWIRRSGNGLTVRAWLFLLGRADDLVNRLPYLVRLWWAARQIRPDIIHGNNEPGANREALVVAWLEGLPYVQHLRGGSGLTERSRRLMDRPSMFVPVSQWLGEELLAAGVAAGRVRQIYDAVNLGGQDASTAVEVRAGLGISTTAIVVAMVGMLLSWKGQRLFLEAVARLPPLTEDTVFLVVGGEPERGERGVLLALQAYARELGIESRVRIVGQVDHIGRCMGQFDVVVSASLRPEPLGLVMLEAMAAACVFVGPAYGAAPEVVVDGVNGFLFEPGLADSLAAKLAQAVNAVRHRPELRLAARAAVQAWFSPQVCAHHTAAVHAALCGPDVHP